MSLFSFAQAQPVFDKKSRFDHAKLLYENQAYDAARESFAQVLEPPYLQESTYFLTLSAIKAGHKDGEELLVRFVEDYPHHLYATLAYRDMAEFYFEKEKYQKAWNYYNRLAENESAETIFKKGYCAFQLDKYDEALTLFDQLEGSFSPYQTDAAYFQGFIYFHNGDHDSAYSFLTQAFDSDQFRKPSIELYIHMLYDQEKFHQLIELVNKELSPVDDGQILNLLANAEYALEKYGSAGKNYTRLLDDFKGFGNEENYFKAGFSHFKIENKEKAVEYFSQAAIAEDSISAYASYYLGVIYAKDNLPFAVSSFENSAKYETKLKEDALYQQGRCLMQLPNYEQAIDVFNSYKSTFSRGKYTVSIDEMLGLAYAQTSNYDQAIVQMETLDRLTPQLKKTYQRASFLKGVGLFNDKKFAEAADLFQKALLHDEDKEITQSTFYWMAEALTLLNQYDEATFYYKSVGLGPNSQVHEKAIYGLGYAYFNLKDYPSANDAFGQFESEFTGGLNKRYLADARLRMADGLFALKSYAKSVEYYRMAKKAGSRDKDYIYFQIGLLNRYLDKRAEAARSFNLLIKEMPQSSRVEQAYFQLAQMDFEQGNEKKAIQGFQVFLDKYPTSELAAFALLNQALAYDNAADNRSIDNYKRILDQYPRHRTANSALLGLQDKNSNGQFDDFERYLEKYKLANPNSEALETIEFESAKTKYYSQQYETAVQGLTHFIASYPQSSLLDEARYLIGEAHYRQQNWSESLANFEMLNGQKDYPKRAKVLYRTAILYKEMGDLESSNRWYYELARSSNTSRHKINVYNGLMDNYYVLSTYDSAIYYGELLLNNPRVDALMGAQANLVIGKSYYELGQLDEALKSLLPLVSNSPDERGAEAYYYISKIYFDKADYERALESLFVLTNHFQQYETWRGEAHLLMADIYIETNELFQAKATLNSLIDHLEQEDIKAKAKEKLKTIEEYKDPSE